MAKTYLVEKSVNAIINMSSPSELMNLQILWNLLVKIGVGMRLQLPRPEKHRYMESDRGWVMTRRDRIALNSIRPVQSPMETEYRC